jgi:hypothetical protein
VTFVSFEVLLSHPDAKVTVYKRANTRYHKRIIACLFIGDHLVCYGDEPTRTILEAIDRLRAVYVESPRVKRS